MELEQKTGNPWVDDQRGTVKHILSELKKIGYKNERACEFLFSVYATSLTLSRDEAAKIADEIDREHSRSRKGPSR